MIRRSFLRQAALFGAGTGLLGVVPGCHSNQLLLGRNNLERATPESQGVLSQGILDFIEAANSCHFDWHSFAILRHNKVIAEGWWDPFSPDYLHTLYSLSKSFTSTAVGFAVEEEIIHLEDRVLSFFQELSPTEPDPNLEIMNVRHLLTMNTGHDSDSFTSIRPRYQEPWVPTFLNHPVPNRPGSKFLYDTGATFMLSAIIQKVTGQSIDDYLKPRLFDPLGIDHYDWEKSPEEVCAGGFGLRVTTDAIARFGQVYLNLGRWNGKQIIPEAWVKEATAKQTESNPGESEWSNGYGYQFWRCKLPGVYRGDGAYGQFCIVMPEADVVIAVTSESWDMGRSMQIIFDHLVPAMSDAKLKEDPVSVAELKKVTKSLKIGVPKSQKTSTRSAEINHKTFRLLNNEFQARSIKLSMHDDEVEWTTMVGDDEIKIAAGIEKWKTNAPGIHYPFPVFFRTNMESRIAATATWLDDDTLQMDLKLVEAIHGDRITFRFKGIELEIEMLNTVAAHDNSDRNRERRATLRGALY